MDNTPQPVPLLPVDIPRIVAEVRDRLDRNAPGPDKGQSVENPSQEDRDILVVAVRRHLQNQEVLARASVESTATPVKAKSGAHSGEPEARSADAAEFERNREQLYHPPERERPARVKTAALIVALFLVLLVAYAAYVNGIFNPLLPEAARHAPQGLERALD